MVHTELLNVVDEDGRIIGSETRERIHREGLLHCIAHVWLYTGHGEVILQRRSPTKDSFPNLLDVSVGGHVEIGQTDVQAAIQEMEEETGLTVAVDDLQSLSRRRVRESDPVTQTILNHLIATYAYRYDKPVDQLRVEVGKATGFEAWPIDTLLNLPQDQRVQFIPSIFDPSSLDVFRAIQKLL